MNQQLLAGAPPGLTLVHWRTVSQRARSVHSSADVDSQSVKLKGTRALDSSLTRTRRVYKVGSLDKLIEKH